MVLLNVKHETILVTIHLTTSFTRERSFIMNIHVFSKTMHIFEGPSATCEATHKTIGSLVTLSMHVPCVTIKI